MLVAIASVQGSDEKLVSIVTDKADCTESDNNTFGALLLYVIH